MMSPMQSGSKFTDRITKYLTKSAERKTTRASKLKGHVISFKWAILKIQLREKLQSRGLRFFGLLL